MKPIEVFQFLKPEYKWIAMDESGIWRGHKVPVVNYFGEKDVFDKFYWAYLYKEKGGAEQPFYTCLDGIDIDYDGDWKDSLFERPDLPLLTATYVKSEKLDAFWDGKEWHRS